MNEPKVIVALDFAQAEDALALVERLPRGGCRLKVGKELFVRAGPGLVAKLVDEGFQVFLDLKFHDIPNTVAAAVKAAADLGVWMVNVHASGGRRMMLAAREVLEGRRERPLLIAVTILTSLGDADLREIGFGGSAEDAVRDLAALAADSGLDGVVASAREAPALRQSHSPGFCIVTPGIRPANAARDDQTRVLTPAQAMEAGASYLVIGRPITRAADPAQALREIRIELGEIA